LASASPRRLDLLKQVGLQPELLLPSCHEDPEALEAVLPCESPQAYVQRVAQLKWQAASGRLRSQNLTPAPILTADTTVALGKRIIGKPQNHQEAREILQALSGKTHRVMTAVVVGLGSCSMTALNINQVSFDAILPADLDRYILSEEPMGKAGAYGIQGAAAQWVTQIVGSYSGIMGLPLHETLKLLRRFEVF
jgi:septum formation protein